MKTHLYAIIGILLFTLCFSSCERTTIEGTDLDFKLTEIADQKGYVGKPIELKTEAIKFDVQNNYPFQIKINSESGNIQINGTSFAKDVYTDVTPQDGKIFITYNPTQIGEDLLNISVKNQLVERHTKANINISADLYSVEVANQPPRPLIDTKFNFDLLVKEAESTGADSILTYARVIDGIGSVYNGEELISSLEENKNPSRTQLYIGKNQITYLSTREGENTIRFFFTNKYGNETYKDVKTTIFLPAWKTDISTGKENVNIPLKEKYSINLSLEEEDIFKDNSYTGAFRVLTNNDLTFSLNAKEVKAGETFAIKQGGNIGELFINEEIQSGAIEFIVKDKYKQEKKDTIRFTTKLPVKPIDASLDETSKKVKVNNKVTFRISVSEVNYNDVFGITCQLITGQGAFDNPEMTVSKGTHEIVYLATQPGTHTFKVTVTDKNNQKKELNATVQAEIQPILTLNKTDGGAVSGGGTYDFNATAVAAAVPITGYSFTGWYRDGVKISDAANYTFTITANTTLEARFTPNKYSIVVNTTTGGEVSGAGSFDYNSKATVVATAQTGYNFLGWYESDKLVSDSPTYSFTVTANRNLTAKFAADKHSITTNATAGGTVSGAGNYDYNSNISVKATPNTGYDFTGWYENGGKVSDSQSYNFVVKGNRVLEARFAINRFNVIVNAQTGGAASGSGAYDYNTNCTVRATVGSNYTFAGWYEGTTKVSSSAEYTFKVLKETVLEARFTVNKYTITLSGTNGTQSGGGSYDYNTNATVRATPNANYTFTGWYEGNSQVSTSNPYIFKVEKDRILEARYQLNKFTVTVQADNGGSATGGGQFDYGTNTQLKATPNTGYSFAGWYEGSTKISGDNPYTLTVVKDRNITAKFNINTYNLLLTAGTGGSVSGAGTFSHNTTVTAVATPQAGYTFEGWYNGNTKVSSSSNYAFTILVNTSLTAKFTQNSYIIAVIREGNGSVTGGGTYNHGTNATLTATPSTGYSFNGWYEDNVRVLSSSSYTFSVNKPRTIIARFEEIIYTVTTQTNINTYEHFKVLGGGQFRYGQTCTLSYWIDPGWTGNYSFNSWYKNGSWITNTSVYTFTVTDNVTITANVTFNRFD